MDYEKKYKEALERAKAMIKVADNQDEAIGFANNIFPELAESKDEKIRKALIRFHKSTIDIDGIKGADVIAWLEKQGEHMEINPTEFDTRLQTLIGKFDNLPKEDLIGSLSFWMNVVQNDGTYKPDKKQSEQKPSWSEEDKDFMYDTLSNLTELKDRYGEGYGNVGKCIDWLKSLKQRIGG